MLVELNSVLVLIRLTWLFSFLLSSSQMSTARTQLWLVWLSKTPTFQGVTLLFFSNRLSPTLIISLSKQQYRMN